MRIIDSVEALVKQGQPAFPAAGLVGFQVTGIERGRILVEFEPSPEHFNPMGTVHGGILSTIADTAMGLAHASVLEEGESYTTLEIKINFLKPVRTEKLRAVGRVVKNGRNITLLECDVLNSQGQLVARASSTSMTLRGEQARGR